MTQEVLKLALEALEQWNTPLYKRHNAITFLRQAIAEAEKQNEDIYVMGHYVGKGKVGKVIHGVSFSGNGTAGREADVRPTGFFFQMPKPVGEVYGWHGSGKGQPMCRFNATEEDMPIGTELYTTPPQRKPLTETQINDRARVEGAQWQKRNIEQTDGMWCDTTEADAKWWLGQKTLHGWEVRKVYTTPPQRTERPVNCERCNRLEEQAYDLVGKLRVANIKLSMQSQRTWVGLTKEQLATTDWSADFRAGALWAEAKLKEKNT